MELIQTDKEKLEDNVLSISIEISMVQSLISFLNMGVNGSVDVNKSDIANLAAVLSERIQVLRQKCEQVEKLMGL